MCLDDGRRGRAELCELKKKRWSDVAEAKINRIPNRDIIY